MTNNKLNLLQLYGGDQSIANKMEHQLKQIDDPSDWPLPGLSDMDAHLRCPMCMELFNTPVMIKECWHVFCSLCIRHRITQSADTANCPMCRKTCRDMDLVPNRILDDLVISFKSIRPQLLNIVLNNVQVQDTAVKAQSIRKKRQNTAFQNFRTLRSRHDESNSDQKPSPTQTPREVVVLGDTDSEFIDDEFVHDQTSSSESSDYTDYPTTQKRSLFLVKSKDTPKNKSLSSSTLKTKPMSRMARVHYAVLKDVQIRNLLNDQFLNSQGSRAQLINRHKLWVQLFNGSLDQREDRRPTINQLIKQLETRERNLKN